MYACIFYSLKVSNKALFKFVNEGLMVSSVGTALTLYVSNSRLISDPFIPCSTMNTASSNI